MSTHDLMRPLFVHSQQLDWTVSGPDVRSDAVRHCTTVNSQQSEIAISDLGEKVEPAPTCNQEVAISDCCEFTVMQ